MIVRTERIVSHIVSFPLFTYKCDRMNDCNISLSLLTFSLSLSLFLNNPFFLHQNEIIKELAPGLVISDDGLPIMPNMGLGQFAPGDGDGLKEGMGGFGGVQGMPPGCAIC